MRRSDLIKNSENTHLTLRFLRNYIDGLDLALRVSELLRQAQKKAGKKITITDIDQLVHSGTLRFGYELKHRSEDFKRYILLNAAQYITLRDAIARLKIPFYYIIRVPGKWRILELSVWNSFEKLGTERGRDTYVKVPVDESIVLNDDELVNLFQELIL